MAFISGTSAGETLTGTSGADTISGNGGDDVLLGEGGDDTLSGAAGADQLDGGLGDDVLYGLGGTDTLKGGDGADKLYGGGGSDVMDGGAGDDLLVIEGDSASDTYTGGAGADTFDANLDYAYASTSTLLNMDQITDFSAAAGDKLSLHAVNGRIGGGAYLFWAGEIPNANFHLKEGDALPTASASGFRGVATWSDGTSRYLIIDMDQNGRLGQWDFVLKFDISAALSRSMFLPGTIGAIIGTPAADIMAGSDATDYLFGFDGADTLLGLGGADVLNGAKGDDGLEGGDGADTLYGGEGSDRLYGGAGDDFLYAGGDGFASTGDTKDSVNFLSGDDGADKLYGSDGRDTLEGGAGDDLLSAGASFLGTQGDILRGGDGKDELYARLATLDGGVGDDRLTIRSGNTLTGGVGADVFWTSSSSFERDGSWVEDGVSVITDYNAAEGDRLSLDNPLIYSSTRLVFRGALDNPTFSLVAGKAYSADSLGIGFTQIWTWSNAGATYLFFDFDEDGKLGNRDVVVKLLGDVKLTAADFNAAYFNGVLGSGAGDTFTGAETADLYFGVGGDDEIRGAGGDDTLYGNMGADKIWGDAGSDRIYGGLGDDIIEGGAGQDYLYGGVGADTLRGGDGGDNIYSGDLDSFYGVDASGTVNIVFGEAGDDYIIGNSAGDQLHGGAGADFVRGAGEIWGDAGGDTLSGAAEGTMLGAVIIHGGDGNDNISGGAYGSILYGDAGWDRVSGGFGADALNVELGDSYANGGYGDDRILIGGLRAGDAPSLNLVSGDWGADIFVPLEALTAIDAITLSGGADIDTVDFSHATGAVQVDLGKSDAQDTGMGKIKFDGIENLIAGDHGSTLTGDANVNVLTGGAGADTLSGGAGRDVLIGGAGDDGLDGGTDVDTVVYLGRSTDYDWTIGADAAVTIKDRRTAAPDGVDTIRNVEFLRFSDRAVALGGFNVAPAVETAFASILRVATATAAQSSAWADLVVKLAAGVPDNQVAATLVTAASATTSVASLAYQFFTGKIPGQGGIDYLVSPTGPNPNNLNSAYYQTFNLENRYINFAVNLGKAGEGKDAFLVKYGATTLFDSTREAYKSIFGAAPTDEKIHAMIDSRVDYLSTYGGDGPEGIGTKAAMVGWLLAEAQKADLGVMVRSNDAWLTDLADGSAPFAINILDPANGYYKAYWIFGGQ